MGVTTIVALQDERRGISKLDANPSPHIYPLDFAGSIDAYSFLMSVPRWRNKLKDPNDSIDLNEEETKAELEDLARQGTRAVYLGRDLRADRTKFIISECRWIGLISYGEFSSTPYADGLKDGVDVLLHMTRYTVGLIPSRLQDPLVQDPEGAPLTQAYAYLRQLDPTDPSIVAYGKQIRASGTALMPTLSLSYLRLPNHRNLWKEPAASILDPKGLHQPSDPVTGEATARYDPNDTLRLQPDDQAHFWSLNRTLEVAHPLNLTGSGSPAFGTMPGISLHTDWNCLCAWALLRGKPSRLLLATTLKNLDGGN